MTDRSSTELDEQRRTLRRAVEAPVLMRLETECLEGTSDNVSSAGIMFFTEEPLRVSVEFAEGDGTRTVHGRLVRVQRMSETITGLAIEFDEE